MAEEEYAKKMETLQQYIPFLNNMIVQLRDPSKKNREQQLSKMESLHAMITDKKKKLKLETLNKCEDVISKLYLKVNHKPLNLNKKEQSPKFAARDGSSSTLIGQNSPNMTSSTTPASPSPPPSDMKDVFDIKPLTIPTERLEPESRLPKIDIYSSVGESLSKAKQISQPPTDNAHLPPKLPDLSKPPISLEDLKGLEDDVQEKITENASLKELTSMRNKIAHQIILEEIKQLAPAKPKDEDINTTVRNSAILTKPVDRARRDSDASSKSLNTVKSAVTDSPVRNINLNLKPKVSSKVVSAPSSVFGSILSTIDEKILSDKKKKEERRSSLGKEEKVGKAKERRSSSASKDDRKNSKDETKGREHDSTDESLKESQNKDDKKKKSVDKRRDSVSLDRKSKEERRSSEKPTESLSKNETFASKKIEPDTKSYSVKSAIFVKKPEDLLEPKADAIASLFVQKIDESKRDNKDSRTPVYKRLADKYNPKPRKSSTILEADVDKSVSESIEANMKVSPPKIPVLNRLSDVPPPPASLVKCSQLEPDIPKVLQNIMNPSTTQLINTMANQLRQSNMEAERMHPTPAPKQPLLPTPPNHLPLLPTPPMHNPHLMSPTDNFISEYAREEYGHNEFVRDFGAMDFQRDDIGACHSRRDLRFDQPTSMPPNNQFIPTLVGQRFNQPFNNFHQNQMENLQPLDFYPSNAQLPPSNQFNGVPPPLLSPETPHFHEHKLNSFGMPPNRDQFLHRDDLRWRLDESRKPWETESRYRGPMTYREYREMRENSRDPRESNRDPREGNRDPRESNRDPREGNRDPREVNRDPRIARDPRENARDPRETARDSKESRESRDNRDPRLNREGPRDTPRDSRDPRLKREVDRSRSRGREDYRTNRFESKFDRMYATSSNRERSRSRSRTKYVAQDKESFSSPLDSLYFGKEEHKTGKGYGKQTFRIPKLKKEDELVKKEDELVKVEYSSSASESGKDRVSQVQEVEDKSDDGGDAESSAERRNSTELKEVNESLENEAEVVETEEKPLSKVEDSQDSSTKDPKLSNSIDSQTQLTVDVDATTTKPTESVEQEVAQEMVIPETKPQETKAPAEQTILAQFFANLLGSQNKKEKKTALYSLISTFSDSFSTKELSKITKIIKADDDDSSEEEEEDTSKPKKPEREDESEEKVPNDTPSGDSVVDEAVEKEEEEEEVVPKRRLRKRITRISSDSPTKLKMDKNEVYSDNSETVPEETNHSESNLDSSLLDDDVVVSVGERIKSRKRLSTGSKPRRKWRATELDKLHEDIQDMFIRDGVLTATGKRMCHLLKDDPHVLTTSAASSSDTEEAPKIRKKPGPKPKPRHPEAAEVNAMKNMCVVIPKIPDSEMMESERSSRRFTRSMTLPESDEDESVHEEEAAVTAHSDFESESSDSDKDASHHIDESQKNTLKRRMKRKRNGWASGIIKKKKKKTPHEDSALVASEDKTGDSAAKEFFEPDKDYYVDFASQKSHACKLCDFHGKFITTHYKTAHPDSEVLSSRFTPSIAAEAIADAKKNLAKYEACVATRGAGKIKFVCRFCTITTIVFPTLFYDHLCTHTGEYRHICPNCGVSYCGAKTLKVHMNTIHKDDAKAIVRKSYNSTILFGYVCGECNYVQMNMKSVEDHINIYHLVRPEIYKVNLSRHFDAEIEKLKKAHESSESVARIEEGDGDKSSELEESKSENTGRESAAKSTELVEEVRPEMAPPKGRKRGPKPGPKSKKKLLEKRYLESKELNSDGTTDTESVSSKQSIDSDKEGTIEKITRNRSDQLDTEKILPVSSKRAAKAKAQEKLKVIMEQSDNVNHSKADKYEERPSEKEDGNGNNVEETLPEESQEISKDIPVENSEEIVQAPPDEDVKKKVKKEVDMNVFTCKTDLLEENKQIELERLQKMEELNKSVGSRTSLNFVDKLCNRLSKKEVVVKQEVAEDLTDSVFCQNDQSPESMPVLEKNPPVVEPAVESAPATPPRMKNPVLQTSEEPVSAPSYDVTQKNDKLITDMIAKLRGKLGAATSENTFDTEDDADVNVEDVDDDDDDGPPPLTHVKELVNIKPSDSSTKTLQIGGLVKVIKTPESTTFCCLVPPCIFSTEHKDVFQAHCRERHVANSLVRDTALCEICGLEIETTEEASFLENLFKHTTTEHADFLKNTSTEGPVTSTGAEPPVKPQNRVLRIRKLSGDALSVRKDWETEIENTQNTSLTNTLPSNDKENETTTNSAEEEPMSCADIETSEENPFPFKIAGVMSLAEPQPPPPLTPITSKQSIHLVIKEAKLTAAEMTKPKKTKKAINQFIEEVGNLYKCPYFYCLFTSNFRDLFERHMKVHNAEPGAMVPCVYCDMKTPWEHMPMHIDIRHANCRFSCSYCMYRAAVKEYVFLHQDRVHPLNDYSVIALPTSKVHKKFAIADVRVDPKSLCVPFKCTQLCKMEFLFENEFRKHLMEFHHLQSFITCGYENCGNRSLVSKLMQHWSVAHGVSLYQCGCCKMSTSEIKLMYHHFSMAHQNLLPDILIRMLTPMSDSVTLGYSAEAFRRMRKIVNVPANIISDEKNDKSPAGNKIQLKPSLSKPDVVKCAIKLVTTTLDQNNFSLVLPAAAKTTSVNMATTNGLTLVTSKSAKPLVASAKTDEVSPSTSVELSATEPPPMVDLGDATTIAPLEHITLSEDNHQDVVAGAEVDPLDLGNAVQPAQSDAPSSDDESDTTAPCKTTKGAEKRIGLLGYQLYRCAFCDFSASNSNDFKKHAARSMACRKIDSTSKPFQCVHCGKCARNSHVFMEHIQVHGMLRFSCSLCGNKFPTSFQAKGHMKHRHNVNQTTLTLLHPHKTNSDTDEYIVKPKLLSLPEPEEDPVSEATASLAASDTVYTPDQMDKIPIRSIFSSEIRCGVCSYSTKVRTNLMRHLQFHSQEMTVPDAAPLNPVPCLDKNEKMFDKMVNLASSSYSSSGRMGGGSKMENKDKDSENLPEFVSTQYRYACCAQNCNYICPEESNLRHHLMALHDDETSFTCVHCKAELNSTGVDTLIKHLKLHGLQLYKCHYCTFMHNQKNKVEKHVNDQHVDLPNKVITVRCMDSEPKDPEEASSSSTPNSATPNQTKSNNKPWRCCICKTRTTSQEGIQNHVLEKHEIDSQYKCALCAYKTNEKDTFVGHFKDHHGTQKLDIVHVYRKVDDGPKDDKDKESGPFDTTPLWQRDRPRVRHIRGILFDESSPTPTKSPKKPTKSVTPSSGLKNNLDLAIESVANGTASVISKEDELIEQVNKMMKKTTKATDGDVIVIEDEDEANADSKTAKATRTCAKRKSEGVAVPGITKISRVDDVLDVATRSPVSADTKHCDEYDGDYLKTLFGEFGQPLNRQLKCPTCNKFKSKRICDFIFHVFKEKKLYRFKCSICSDESITYRYMSKHVKEHKRDGDFREYIIELPSDRRLEVWIQMLISLQCSIILGILGPVREADTVADQKVLCRYCNKWYRSEQERNEHALSHWRLVPFGCNMCHFLGFTRSQVEQHFEQTHEGCLLDVTEKGPTVASEIHYTDEIHKREAEEEGEKKREGELKKGERKREGELKGEAVGGLDRWKCQANVSKIVLPQPEVKDKSQQEDTSVTAKTDPLKHNKPVASAAATVDSNDVAARVADYTPPEDLVIVTKTDSDVPTDGDVFCCEYCPFMSNSEMLIMSHISGLHEHMHIKFKKLNNKTKNDDFVGCCVCKEVGSEIAIRKHFMEKHEGSTFMIYRYSCGICGKRFLKLQGLKTHSIRTHPGVSVCFTHLLDETIHKESNVAASHPAKEPRKITRIWKTYQCTECSYKRDLTTHSLNNLRVHLKQHFKPYLCGECQLGFKSLVYARNHFRIIHPDHEENITYNKSIEDGYHAALATIYRNSFVVDAPTTKSTARKSTSTPYQPAEEEEEEEYSFYGQPIERVDLSKISTSVELNGMCLNMSADKLAKIFDLEPHVLVQDCNVTLDLSAVFES